MEQVKMFKYLATEIDQSDFHKILTQSPEKQCVFLLRRLKRFSVPQDTITMVSQSLSQSSLSILHPGAVCLQNHFSVSCKNKGRHYH